MNFYDTFKRNSNPLERFIPKMGSTPSSDSIPQAAAPFSFASLASNKPKANTQPTAPQQQRSQSAAMASAVVRYKNLLGA